MLMFSRTLLFRQILSRLKRFQTDKLYFHHLSVKYALFTDKLGIGDCLHDLFSSAATYQ